MGALDRIQACAARPNDDDTLPWSGPRSIDHCPHSRNHATSEQGGAIERDRWGYRDELGLIDNNILGKGRCLEPMPQARSLLIA
jgi:hypothetical protein